MTFFARPDLSDVQFKQLSGSTLTLSGTTDIVRISGFTLSNGSGTQIPITVEGAGISGDTKNGYSLVYNHGVGRVELQNISGGTGTFTCIGATTCTVGGISEGSTLSGCAFEDIFYNMLFPTVDPVITAPSQTFNISPTTSIYEVGSSYSVTGNTTFCRGTVSPVYDSGGTEISSVGSRSGEVVCYQYCGTLDNFCVSTSASANTRTISGNIGSSNNTWISQTYYSSGETVYDSSGSEFVSGLTSGFTASNKCILGIFPYFWGKAASSGASAGDNRPDPTPELITGGTKVVGSSNSTINVNFNSGSDDYIWFAIPSGATNTKTCWYVNALNNGAIGGAVSPGGNLFPDEVIVTGVTSSIWDNVGESPQTYKLYISNYQSAATQIMQLRNT